MKQSILISSINRDIKLEKLLVRYPFTKPNQIKKASIYCDKVYETVLEYLSKYLNKEHNLNWSKRSWRILIGPWLARFIETTYEKWHVLENLKDKCPKIIIKARKNKNYNFSCYDHDDFSNKNQTDEWNELILTYLIERYSRLNLKKSIKGNYEHQYNSIKKEKLDFFSFYKKIVLQSLSRFLRLFIKTNDGIIYYSYINGVINKFKLSLSLGQLPQIYSFSDYNNNYKSLQKITRKRKTNFKFCKNRKDKFLIVIEDLINKMFPVIYLEKFQHLQSLSSKRGFPKKPKFILTSCPPITKDETFKFWVSCQVYNKKKLIMMQHGGAAYGTPYFQPSVPRHEIKISDKFLSWGWGENGKILKVPAPIILNQSSRYIRNGKMLLVFHDPRKHITTFQADSLWGERTSQYYKQQSDFLLSLPNTLISKFFFKFFPGREAKKIEFNKYLTKTLRKTIFKQLEENHNFNQVQKNYELLIFNYNSTGFLEAIGIGRPCILFLDKKVMPFSNKEAKIFGKLKKVGILHFHKKSLINHLNNINDNIDKWWSNKEVKIARNIFCNRFVLSKDDCLKIYRNILIAK